MLMRLIDLNCDMGEMPEHIADGTQEALMASVTSVNIACGGHAGDERMMRATIQQAMRDGVAIGAHPGYEDRGNFGRVELQIANTAVAESVWRQVTALDEVAREAGARITHVKPHGALYNSAARNRELARAIAEGVRRWSREVILVGLAGSAMLDVFREAGFETAAEAFADRRYEPDGSLRSRRFKDAIIRNEVDAGEQAVGIAREGVARTICIHGDTPGAAGLAAAVRKRLVRAGFVIAPLR